MRHHVYAFNAYGVQTGGTSGPAVSVVSAASGYDEAGSTAPTFTFNAQSLVSGNVIVCIVLRESATETFVSANDTQGNTYTRDVADYTITAAPGTVAVDVLRATIGVSTTNTVTFNYSGSAFKHIGGFEVANLAATPLDGHSGGYNNSAGALTPSIANGAALGFGFCLASHITGAGSGFTQVANNSGFDSVEFMDYTTLTSINTTFTWTSASDIYAFGALYKGT